MFLSKKWAGQRELFGVMKPSQETGVIDSYPAWPQRASQQFLDEREIPIRNSG
jgi:hypothetical protein